MSQDLEGCGSVIRGEFEGAQLGDARLSRRLLRIVQRVSERPSESFPRRFADDGQLEGAYRFLNNSRVEAKDILAPHYQQTQSRAEGEPVVWVAHDTSFMRFNSEGRVGMGPLTGKTGVRGFLAHVSLAIAPGQTASPLGVIGLDTRIRPERSKGKRSPLKARNDPTNERWRWRDGIDEAGSRLSSSSRVVHIMDREADGYDLFSQIQARGEGFVVRLALDRCTTEQDSDSGLPLKLSDFLPTMEGSASREVVLSRRKLHRGDRPKHRNPPRERRLAQLLFAGTPITLRRPESAAPDTPAQLSANLVRVWEPEPPEGEQPIEWKLLTTEPIDDEQALLNVVDAYRARWLIEELFKALKTGCAFEKRQLEHYDALVRALAIFLPIAWQLLRLRALARTRPDAPATTVLSELQLTILNHFSKKKLPEKPTVEQALYCVAALGGHLKRNGPPGWQTLGCGLERLLAYEEGWRARDEM